MPRLSEKILYVYARHFPLRSGKMRVVNTFWRHVVNPDDTVRTAGLKIGGFSMKCDLRKILQRQFYFFGTYFLEEATLNCWSDFARSAEMVLDVGANAGIYSLAALAGSPTAAVHAFEPTPALASRLRETVALNRLKTLHVHELAVARTSGTAQLNIWEGEDGSNEGMNFVTAFPKATATLPIRTISLDDFCTEQGIRRIDLLKLDIQGNEAEALAGAECLFAERGVSVVFIELNWAEDTNAACPATKSLEFLSRNGFEFAQPGKRLSFKPAGDWVRGISEIVAKRKV
jgi:FkbM family methyltransferase